MRNTAVQYMTGLETKHSTQWAVPDLCTLPASPPILRGLLTLTYSTPHWGLQHWNPARPGTGAPHGGRHCSCQVKGPQGVAEQKRILQYD